MFISVDLPAPFSPSSACTSPRRTSNETSSLATTPGNSLRMPRISRTRSSSATCVTYHPGDKEGGLWSPPSSRNRCLPQHLPPLHTAGGLSLWWMICDLYLFISVIHALCFFVICDVILPTPTPLFFRLKSRSLPPLNLPLDALTIVS